MTAAEEMVSWDSWLRVQSLKAIGRAFGKPLSLFIASWLPVLRRPVETTDKSGHWAGPRFLRTHNLPPNICFCSARPTPIVSSNKAGHYPSHDGDGRYEPAVAS